MCTHWNKTVINWACNNCSSINSTVQNMYIIVCIRIAYLCCRAKFLITSNKFKEHPEPERRTIVDCGFYSIFVRFVTLGHVWYIYIWGIGVCARTVWLKASGSYANYKSRLKCDSIVRPTQINTWNTMKIWKTMRSNTNPTRT